MSCGALAERSPGTAAAYTTHGPGGYLVECIHPVSAPPYGRREPRRGSATSTNDGEHRFRWRLLHFGSG